MLDIKLLQKNIDYIISKLKSRNIDKDLLNDLSETINKRNKLIFLLNEEQEKKNKISKELANNRNQETLDKASEIKKNIKSLENEIELFQNKLDQILPQIPNIPIDFVPLGYSEDDNVEVARYENLGRGLVKDVIPHYEIGLEKGMIEFERATKMSGSRFVLFKNEGARLVRALENMMIDVHTSNGYEEILPPVLINSKMLFGTGQLPKFEHDLFKIEGEDLWLIPTAEVPLTNYYNNEIIDLEKTKKFTAYTLCFRSEAGSSGKDTKGLIRSRQFNKVEIIKITNEENALSEFESCVKDAEKILQLLEIPYRKVLLCTGDLGFSSSITYDLEIWLPSEQKFREVSSISYFGDFQARRAKIRYKNKDGKVKYAHTINGSGLAIDRVIAVLLEQYQNKDGSIDIPNALKPYISNNSNIKF